MGQALKTTIKLAFEGFFIKIGYEILFIYILILYHNIFILYIIFYILLYSIMK